MPCCCPCLVAVAALLVLAVATTNPSAATAFSFACCGEASSPVTTFSDNIAAALFTATVTGLLLWRECITSGQFCPRCGVIPMELSRHPFVRRVQDRPRDPAKWNEIADVAAALSIPVIANGDVFEYEDFERIKDSTGAASVMVARGAMWNASVFCSEGKLPYEDVKREYLRKCILWDNDLKSTKQTLKEMIMHYSSLELAEGKAVNKAQTTADLAKLYGLEDYYQVASCRHRLST